MAKFDYKKWIIENKYGKLNEQAGSALVKIRNCGGSSTYNTCLPNASYYALGHQFKYSSPFGTRTGFLQSIVQQGCGNTPNINILEDPYLGACANNNLSGSIDTTGTTGPATTTISPATGSVTGSGAVTGSVTGSSPTSTITCYACAYEASDIADGAPYTPAATIEIEFSGASINSGGGCAPTGMGNNYMFSELSSQLVANGITPAQQNSYDMLASAHGIPLQGHWSTDINQTGCPSLQMGPTTGPSTGSATDYDPDFMDDYDDATTQDFPTGFDPDAWSNSWFDNFFNFIDFTATQPPFNAPPNLCPFIEGRIQLWTSQYQTAGPLYQNQLLFKIQVAYIAQDYFECSGAPGNEYTGMFVEQIS